MLRWSFLLLVFCFIYSGILPVGNTPTPVTGKKGCNATLTCEFKGNNISDIKLKHKKNIDVCQTENCTGRVFRKGACDVIIRNLSFSDAGTYFLKVYYDDGQTVQDSDNTSEYHLHIQDEISVKEGKDLKLDVLLSNADKVERNSSEGWTEVWTRGHGVNSDRLTVSDETLIINAFIANDAGTYRVLDSKGETLITVSVTESSPEGSKGRLRDTEQPKPQGDLNSTGNTTSDTEQQTVETPLIVGVCFGVLVVLGVLVALVLSKFDVKTCQRRRRQGGKTYEGTELHVMSSTGHQAQDS